MQVLVILGRKSRVAVVGRGTGREDALTELARAGDGCGLLVAQPKCYWVEHRRVGINPIEAHALAGLVRHHWTATGVAAAMFCRKSSSAALKAAGRSRLTR